MPHFRRFKRPFSVVFGCFVLESDVFPPDIVVFVARRALYAPSFLCPSVKSILDRRSAFDGRSRTFKALCVIESSLTSHSQVPRIAFFTGRSGPAVTLITENISHRHGCQCMRFCTSAHDQHPTGIAFLQHRVVAGSFCIPHQFLEDFRVPEHGPDSQLAVLLRIVNRRLDQEDAPGILVDHVSDHVVERFTLADLRRRHNDDMTDVRIIPGVHNLLQVRCTARSPFARFSGCLV